MFADRDGETVAYTCYGPIAVTVGSYDLYWIAVDKQQQHQGWGRILLAETERLIRAEHGRRIYIETSTREHYAPTRAFYERCGYHCEAAIKDFYAPGDDQVDGLHLLESYTPTRPGPAPGLFASAGGVRWPAPLSAQAPR